MSDERENIGFWLWLTVLMMLMVKCHWGVSLW